MTQHVEGRHLRIDTELLRQIAEHLADLVLLIEDIEVVKEDCPRIRVLQRRDRAHERAFASAVRAEQTEHVIADCQREVF